MKIAFDYSFTANYDFKREGITRYNSFLIDALLRNDSNLKIEIWCLKINYNAVLESFSFLNPSHKKRISFVVAKKYHSRKFVFHNTLLDKIKKSKADVVFIDNLMTTGNLCFKGPRVFMLHDLFTILLPIRFKDYGNDMTSFNNSAVRLLENYCKIGTKFVTSTSFVKYTQLCYVRNLNLKDCDVIDYPAMAHPLISFLSREETKKIIGSNKPYIFYASQNRPNKNFIMLLKALNLLISKGINISLVTTGNMKSLSITDNYIKKNNLESNIFQIKAKTNEVLYSLYKYSECVAIPTIVEGPGLPQQVKEALIFGPTPVVCTKCLGVEESLKDHNLDFSSADLNWVEIDDYKMMAIKLEDVIAHRLSHINKQKNIINNYQNITWDDVAIKYLKILNEQSKHKSKL